MTLKEIRESKGLSRKDVSQMSGISIRTLQDYEQGHKSIASAKGETLYRLSIVLGCSIEEILDPELITLVKEQKKNVQRYKRLLAYQLHPSITGNQVKQCQIYSEKYKTSGRWKMDDITCNLVFLYDGEFVQIPFDVAFSAEDLRWLKEAAIMAMESYIEELEFQKKCASLVKDLEGWNEW